MEITRGKIAGPQKVVVYGPEGIGKSTFAAHFPDPLFIDTEDSTKHMDVARTQKPSSWTMLLSQVEYVKRNPVCSTLIIDTVDWAEQLCINHICSTYDKKGIEDFGYGKGYTYLAEEFGKFLNSLTDLLSSGINVVLTAHAQMRKFEQPDEMGSYDRWEMKLQKKTAPLAKEWADMVLFANYKTVVVQDDNGKAKAQGGKRIMHTTHHPAWDAKNRHDLKPELPLEYAAIAHCIPGKDTANPQPSPAQVTAKPALTPEPKQESLPVAATVTPPEPQPEPEPEPEPIKVVRSDLVSVPKPLADLMTANDVTPEEIQAVVAKKGYYPADTPIANYDAQFINGVLVGAWKQVHEAIVEERMGDAPF